MIVPSTDTRFEGKIKVASRIIDYLSSGLYHTPAACLKELVNNSYDALATRVDVFVKPHADRIIVADNGAGMSKDDFIQHFDRISESHKRDVDNVMEYGRKKIGKIGIGFIAANELCEVMEIYSTQAGSTELLHVRIDFAEMRKPQEERERIGDDFVKGDYEGEILQTDPASHYTELYLEAVRGEAKEILASATAPSQRAGGETRSLYGLGPESIVRQLRDENLRTWMEFDAYSQTMLGVALNVPVQYYPGWLPADLQHEVKDIEDQVAALDFNVFYDGTPLGKPIVFSPPGGESVLSKFSFQGNHVSAYGYFYAQHGTIKPLELQGLLIRIRQAAVGEYDHQFWDFSPNEFPLIQRWVSAEIWVDDRLEDAMNIDRRTLREAHPAFVELRDAIHRHLRGVLSEARSELYQKASNERKEERTDTIITDIERLADKYVAPVAPEAAAILKLAWRRESKAPSRKRTILRKFTVVGLYEVAIDVAKEILPPDQFAHFIQRLTERILR